MRFLPTTSYGFAGVRQTSSVYFDRTGPLIALAKAEAPVLLCRPKGFGKSLSCSALALLLEGRRELFKDLEADRSDWSWEPHEVIHLRQSADLAKRGGASPEPGPAPGPAPGPDLVRDPRAALSAHVEAAARRAKVRLGGQGPGPRLASLMAGLAGRRGRKVAVVIDDLDAPLWPVLGRPEAAGAALESLGGLLEALEGPEDWRGPVFLASTLRLELSASPGRPGLTRLVDATLDPRFAAFGGLTAAEISDLVAERLPEPSQRVQALRCLGSPSWRSPHRPAGDLAALIMDLWGGHCWDGRTLVANTWQVLMFFQSSPNGRAFGGGTTKSRRRRWTVPAEPAMAAILAESLRRESESFAASSGLSGLPILQGGLAVREPAVLDPGRPDSVGLALHTGHLVRRPPRAATGLSRAVSAQPPGPSPPPSLPPGADAGLPPALPDPERPTPGPSDSGPADLAATDLSTSGSAPPVPLAPSCLAALGELANLILSDKARIDDPCGAAATAASFADALDRRDVEALYQAFIDVERAFGLDVADELDRCHSLAILALALAGRPFTARGRMGDPEFTLRLEDRAGDLTLVAMNHKPAWKNRGDDNKEWDFFERRVERGRRQAMAALGKAAGSLRREGRRIVKIALVSEGILGDKWFAELDEPAPPRGRGGG